MYEQMPEGANQARENKMAKKSLKKSKKLEATKPLTVAAKWSGPKA
jgi:hypothetical protein